MQYNNRINTTIESIQAILQQNQYNNRINTTIESMQQWNQYKQHYNRINTTIEAIQQQNQYNNQPIEQFNLNSILKSQSYSDSCRGKNNFN